MDRCDCTCGKYACASVRGRRHGTESCYRDGCRCEDCRAFASRSAVQRKRRLNATTLRRATKARQPWTSAEMEIVMRDDLSILELAEMLGRSYKAVIARRTLCRTDPKWMRASDA